MSQANSKMLVQPYLFYGGRCEEAIEFYRSAIGAELLMLVRFKESPEPRPGLAPGNEEKVMHASFKIGQSTLMASDGRCDGKANFDGFTLSISVASEAEADRIFAALGEGGKVKMPMMKTFWSPKYGMLEDKFGLGWMVSMEPGVSAAG